MNIKLVIAIIVVVILVIVAAYSYTTTTLQSQEWSENSLFNFNEQSSETGIFKSTYYNQEIVGPSNTP